MIKKIISDEHFAIETRRLHITPVTKEEASHYLREFDLEVTRYQYSEPFASIESVKSFVEDFEKARQEDKHLVASIYDKERNFVGSIEFYNLDTDQPAVGIWICRNEWRKGYAYEALRGMIKYFEHHTDVEGFLYEADRRNEASIALAKKLKAKQVGYHEVVSDSGRTLQLTKYLIMNHSTV